MKISKLPITALFASVISLAALSAPAVLRADNVTYIVNQSLTGGSITGTITTDGTLGTLATTNIVDWNLTATLATNSQILTQSDSQVFGTGNDLIATPAALTLEFSEVDYGYLSFAATSPTLGYASWVAGYVPGSYGYISANVTDNLGLEAIDYEAGTQVIATATPEPGAAVLLITGIGSAFVMRKRIARGFPQAI